MATGLMQGTTYQQLMDYYRQNGGVVSEGGSSGEWGGVNAPTYQPIQMPDGTTLQMTPDGQLAHFTGEVAGHGQNGGGANLVTYAPDGTPTDRGWQQAGDGNAWKTSLLGALAVGVGGPLAGYSAGLLTGATPAAAAGSVAAEEALMGQALAGTAGTTGHALPAAAAASAAGGLGPGGASMAEGLYTAETGAAAGSMLDPMPAIGANAEAGLGLDGAALPGFSAGTGALTAPAGPAPTATTSPTPAPTGGPTAPPTTDATSALPGWLRENAPWLIPAVGAAAGAAGAKGGESTSVRELPAWAQDSGRRFLQQSEDVANRPYQDYQGQRVSSWNDQQQHAGDMVSRLATEGNSTVNQAQVQQQQNISGDFLNRPEFGATTQVGTNPWLGKSNEYLQPSIDMAVGDVARNFYDNTMPGIQGSFNTGGGNNFFNTGRVLQEEKAREGAARTAGDISTNMRVADRGQQISMSETDVNRRLSANQADLQRNLTGLLSGMDIQQNASQFAPNWQTADLNRANALAAAGTARGEHQQRDIDADRQRWEASWNYPQQQLDTWRQGFGPTQQTFTETRTGEGTNPWLAAAGGLTAGMGAYKTGRQYGWW